MCKTWVCLVLVMCLFCSSALAMVIPVTDQEKIKPEYLPENRTYAAMPSVEVTGSRIWATWTAGGDTEPHDENYIIVVFSDDGGETWQDPYMILDPGAIGRTSNSVFWLAPNGRLWLFYVDRNSYSMYTDNPEAAPEDIVWSKAKNLDGYTLYNKPIAVERNGEWVYLAPVANSFAHPVTQILTSDPSENKWKLLRGQYLESDNPRADFTEPSMVERSDGTLWLLSRLEKGANGGVEQAFSQDDGKTWTELEDDLPYPLQGPGSRFQFYKLQSGHLVWVSHDQTSSRTNLTIWLSEDDGVTWPYKLLLDDRSNVSYPDITQAADGKIYVIYDKGRSVEQEIRLAIFTEEDIRAGMFVTEDSRQRMPVTQNIGYTDILSFEEIYEQKVAVSDESALEAVRESLPTVLHGMTDEGETVILKGEWKITDRSDEGAKIRFFTEMPEKTQDLYSLLTVEVSIK